MKKKAYKYRFYPTNEQALLLAKTFGCVRFIYNRILKTRTDAYYQDGTRINYSAASKLLTGLKKDPELVWLGEVAAVALQQALRHQQTAFTHFWDGRSKYPIFKKKNHDNLLVWSDLPFDTEKAIFTFPNPMILSISDGHRHCRVNQRLLLFQKMPQDATLLAVSATLILNRCPFLQSKLASI